MERVYNDPYHATATIRLFESLIPNRLKSLVLFEDHNDAYATIFQRTHALDGEDPHRRLNAGVSRALAEASLDLESLSASFIVDASSFFLARQATWVWNKLVSLVLTSRLLVPHESQTAIDDVLQTAAAAAINMPRLNTMELWNSGTGLACVFRYQAPKGYHPAAITWRGNWDLQIEPQVIRSWEAVTFGHAQSRLLVVKELLDADVVIMSHGDAIRHLKPLHRVVHPVSLC